jgi:hypothetical protein
MVFALTVWSLVVFGITNGINTGGLFTPMWTWLCTRNSWILNKIGELFSCPKCLGFWVAGIVSQFIEGPVTNTWFVDSELASKFDFDTIILVGNMFAGSAACWLLHEWKRDRLV